MFWKKKKNDLNYSWIDLVSRNGYPGEELSKGMLEKIIVDSSPKSSCWFSNMKSKVGDLKTIDLIKKSHIDSLKNGGNYTLTTTTATVKTCPGVISFFKNSFLLKFPYDTLITINPDGSFISETRRDDGLLTVSTHNEDQFRTGGECDLFKNKINIKFCFGVNISTDEIPWTFIQPIYHNEQPFIVAPGIIDKKQTKLQNLNVITFFDVPKNEPAFYHFKSGEVLAYMKFNENVNLKYIDYDLSRKVFPGSISGKW